MIYRCFVITTKYFPVHPGDRYRPRPIFFDIIRHRLYDMPVFEPWSFPLTPFTEYNFTNILNVSFSINTQIFHERFYHTVTAYVYSQRKPNYIFWFFFFMYTLLNILRNVHYKKNYGLIRSVWNTQYIKRLWNEGSSHIPIFQTLFVAVELM